MPGPVPGRRPQGDSHRQRWERRGVVWAQATLLLQARPSAPSLPAALLFSLLSLIPALPPARQALFSSASLGVGLPGQPPPSRGFPTPPPDLCVLSTRDHACWASELSRTS